MLTSSCPAQRQGPLRPVQRPPGAHAGSQEQPAVPGSDVELTLDRDIQWAAQSAITEQ